MSVLRPVAVDELRRQPWANGAGVTTEIACGPHQDAWQWRLSIADIENAASFSTFADARRQFVPLDAPVELTFPDGRTQFLNRFDLAKFSGDSAPHAGLPEGATRAFNLMLRGDVQGELIARPLHGAMVLLAPKGWHWFVLLLAGQAKVIADHRSHMLEPNDMMWIDPIPAHPVRIEGGGEVVLARLPTG
ncbi:HutD/Ves family protein [Dyella sp. Tek66A03]|jgi:environmental stress-induced protein Ves|uniref:HutD/Ves family protein n=1 Tax=Dyella sp. Tek66A03 TaxID=3458298 RepID=UPI0031B94C67